ncbi:hypothetical protein TrLO_g1603 [Triparma laevis f. longispina]|uniref:Uncharacterized protein n=1 Tax=Triparma laevis f. longispina TaxID=1714387 RepID=A0A9W7F619_9STRA|nr:hypothetical protein TrLO_g1603 [Triparma laevis f. longispina]
MKVPADMGRINAELNDVARNTDDTNRARALVAAGADLSSTNGPEWRHTPLHQAAFHGRYEMAKCLIELGSPLTQQSNPCGRGSTGIPLELARGGGHTRIAEIIEQAMSPKPLTPPAVIPLDVESGQNQARPGEETYFERLQRREQAYAYWKATPKMYGKNPSASNVCDNFVLNALAGHQLTGCCVKMKVMELEGVSPLKEAEEERNDIKCYNICAPLISIGLGLFCFSAFAAIELYMELGCSAGCVPFKWPNVTTSISNDPRFDATAWRTGTEMCYPVYDPSAEEGSGTWEQSNGTFPLGNAYPKPFPTNWCEGDICENKNNDELYTWGVQMNLIGGVILGADDHHCKEDECYYIQRAVWNSTLCDRSDFEVGKSKWIITLLWSELIQFSVQFTFNFLIKTCNSKAWLCAAAPLCCMLVPSIMFILGAAMFNGVFAKYLFVPFFAALITEWATALVVPPLLTLPIYFTHRAQFKRLFPGAKNIQDFKSRKELEPGCDVKEFKGGLHFWEKFCGAALFMWEMFTKVS